MILILGSTGLVGSHLLLKLLEQKQNVRVLLRTYSNKDFFFNFFKIKGKETSILNNVEWVEGDILDTESLANAMINITHVYNCSGVVMDNSGAAETMLKVNSDGVANIINAALSNGIKKLCHVSSIAALGLPENSNDIDETVFWEHVKGRSIYSYSKYLGEQEVWRGQAEGLSVIIVNPSIILGFSDKKRSSSQIFETIYKYPYFYTSGINAFVDVNDVTEIMIKLMNSNIENERFIISCGDYSYKYIFSLIAKNFNKTLPKIKIHSFFLKTVQIINFVLNKIFKIKIFISNETAKNAFNTTKYDNKKIIRTLNYSFKPIEDTILRVCEEFIKNKNSHFIK